MLNAVFECFKKAEIIASQLKYLYKPRFLY